MLAQRCCCWFGVMSTGFPSSLNLANKDNMLNQIYQAVGTFCTFQVLELQDEIKHTSTALKVLHIYYLGL